MICRGKIWSWGGRCLADPIDSGLRAGRVRDEAGVHEMGVRDGEGRVAIANQRGEMDRGARKGTRGAVEKHFGISTSGKFAAGRCYQAGELSGAGGEK